MASGKRRPPRRSFMRSSRKRKGPRKHRGPIMRFKFGRLVLLWIFSLILCFGLYLYNRNVHPEKDVFVKKAASEEADSTADDSPDTQTDDSQADTPAADNSADSPSDDTADYPTDVPNEEADESSVSSGPAKINPVPESLPQSPDYLTHCAFLGETNIYNLGQEGLLQPYSVYASETLTLENYQREYVMLDGTTIRILSAVTSASCPIYLMFGTESLYDQAADETANQFTSLLNSVIATAPEATIYVMSIPPVTYAAENNPDKKILNSTIDEYNSLLLEACNKHNVYFIDVNTALKNNDSKLAMEFADEDGVHLNSAGGQCLLTYVLNHVPEPLPQN